MSIHRALDLAAQVYWANEQPKLSRLIEDLLETIKELAKEPPDAPHAFWLGRDGANPLDGTRLWDNS